MKDIVGVVIALALSIVCLSIPVFMFMTFYPDYYNWKKQRDKEREVERLENMLK